MKPIFAVLALALIAAAPPSGPVKVGPPNRLAQFAGTGVISLGGPCTAVETTALADLPDCSALLDKGATGATIIAASRMMVPGNPNFDPARAIRQLERSIAAENHAAAHYLQGSIYASGESVPPRFAVARAELTQAMEGRNPAAADLLATLWLRGQGGPQDIGKALELYESAVAGGFAAAFPNLLQQYLTGRWTPPNPARVEALLAAAEAAGYPQIAQVRAQVAGRVKMTSVQTIPPVGSGPPGSVAFTGFEGPELPPSVGFDAAFQKIYRSADSDPAVIADLKARLATLPSPYLYELARRIAPAEPREALVLFQLASVRMTYDGLRCADRTALQGINFWPPLMRQQLGFALRPAADQAAVVDEVLKREEALPADTVPVWICYHSIAGVQAGLDGKPLKPLLVPASEWPALRLRARQLLVEARQAPK